MRSTPSFVADAIRGSGEMPHVGSHPGTAFALLMLAIMSLACAQAGGLAGAALGLAGWAIVILPVFLVGAASRARLSDRVERQQMVGRLLSAWMTSLSSPPKRPVRIKFYREGSRITPQVHQTGQDGEPDLPVWISRAVAQILTHSPSGDRPHRPDQDELGTITLIPEAPSMHERIAAIDTLRDARLRYEDRLEFREAKSGLPQEP